MSNIYWSKNRILSYNKLWNFVVGARGIGKTYACKDWAISDYIKNGKKTCWGMRYLREVDRIVMRSKFFDDIKNKYKGYEFKIENYIGYIRYVGDTIEPKNIPWEDFINFFALSERSLKAISNPDVNKIIFDEFIPLPGIPYLKDEVERFAEYYFTIDRGFRGTRALFLSNMVSSVSPYFTYFHIKLPEIGKIFAGDEIAVENCKNEPFAELMRSSRFGKLMQGTHYSDYAIDNETLIDLSTFVVKRDKHAKCLIRILTDMGELYLWIYKCNIWLSTRGDKNAPVWSTSDSSHTEGAERVDFASSIGRKFIKAHYANGTLFFDSDDAKAIFMGSCTQFIK